jgi:ligand-binding SRPBCC domain-containing protein
LPAIVEIHHAYPVSPDDLWRVAADWTCLEQASRGLLRYGRLPDGKIIEGQSLTVDISLFGVGPWFPWTIIIDTLEPEARIMRCIEFGGAARSWIHAMRVEPMGGGAVLKDRIEIDAGVRTPGYALFANILYRRRHRPRRRMLGV